jgi:hypothetical protein
MTPLTPARTRKRTIDDTDSDPCRFLQTYYRERGIPESPEDDESLLVDCVVRADGARESFKRWRGGSATVDADPDKPTVALTPSEKYKRRLVNNRRSAAAARVYQEVLRREHTHALRKAAAERDRLAQDVERLGVALHALREENEMLARIEKDKKEKRKIYKDAVVKDEVDAHVNTGDAPSSGEDEASDCEGGAGFDAEDVGDASPEAKKIGCKKISYPLGEMPGFSAAVTVMKTPCTIPQIFGSQGSNQAASQGDLDLPVISPAAPSITPAPPLFSLGMLGSQLSAGLAGCLQATPPSAPNIDDFTESSQLFAFSQGFASQPLHSGSQPLASQSG